MSIPAKNIIEPIPIVERRAIELADGLLRNEGTVHLFLFGSHATGRAFPRSDIDIGIDLGHPIAPGLRVRIREAFDELPIFQKVDAVDFSEADEAFKGVALKRIKSLYERKAA